MLDYENAIAPDKTDAVSLRQRMVRRVQRALTRSANGATPRVVRVALEVGAVDPFAWLQAQPLAERLYWSGRCPGVRVAAIGAAEVLTSTAASVEDPALARQLRARFAQADDTAPLRYYGGGAFDPGAAMEGAWRAFGMYRFVLPRFELRTTQEGTTLLCNLLLPRDASQAAVVREQVEQLAWPAPERRAALPPAVARTNRPARDEWMRMVAWALDAIARDQLAKVVLARRSTFDFADALDPVRLLAQLEAATPNCFHFLFQPEPATAFVGASPEQLFRRAGQRVHTEAVAGTRSRGDSARADAALRNELLESEKDRREHAFVANAIRDRLSALCATVEQEATASELRLTRGRHLRSQFEGVLRKGVTTLDVLGILHPTPAIGGVPTEKAMQAIRAQEPFARGWYTGPVGWIGANAAEFAVAIRAGLVHDQTLALYSGAGIVDGSVPEHEWDEIEQKIGDFAAVLDLAL